MAGSWPAARPHRTSSENMLPIKGIYEVAIKVRDLARAEEFYREVLDLEVGVRDERRNWLFLRAGVDAVGEVVFQEWMPAKSIYFDDPDKNVLELCAPGKRK